MSIIQFEKLSEINIQEQDGIFLFNKWLAAKREK